MCTKSRKNYHFQFQRVFSVSAAASTTDSRASAAMFFPNYQLTKENLSPKTDNIYVLIVFINSTNLRKVLRNVSNWGKITKLFFPKPIQFRKKFLNPYHLGTSEFFS